MTDQRRFSDLPDAFLGKDDEYCRNLLRTVWHHAICGLALIDADSGHFRHVNETYCRILEYTAAELVNRKTWMEITYRGDLDADLEMSHQTAIGEHPKYGMTKKYRTKRGHLVDVYIYVVPFIWRGENVDLFVVQCIETVKLSVQPAERTPGGVVAGKEPRQPDIWDAMRSVKWGRVIASVGTILSAVALAILKALEII